jgi:hypothetical protein
VRLACPCGRNLADIRLTVSDPPADVCFERDKHLWAFPRPGVRHSEYGHGGGGFTFRWECRCGRTHEARSDRIEMAWRENAQGGRVVRVILGHDV